MRKDRRSKLINIIKYNKIYTQEELLSRLNEYGYNVTQATVSRDIRELGITKISNNGGRTYYSISNKSSSQNTIDHGIDIFKSCVLYVQVAQNLVIVKTKSGAAMIVAAIIDNIGSDGVVGCIAGDDTIFVATVDNICAEVLKNNFSNMIQE